MCRLLHHPRPGRRGAQLDALRNKDVHGRLQPLLSGMVRFTGILAGRSCRANSAPQTHSYITRSHPPLCEPTACASQALSQFAARTCWHFGRPCKPSGFEPAGFFQPGGKAGEVRTLHCARLFACLLLAGCTLLFFLRRSAKSVRLHRPLNPLGFTFWSLLSSAQLPADVQVLRGRLVPEN
jgi:hypothetical protein